MKIIKPRVFITEFDPTEIMRSLEAKARLCYRSFDNISSDSADRLVRNLIKRGHEAMIEHESLHIQFVCDRGVTHEIVRHRLGAYAQESTRYCNYASDKLGGELTVIEPFFFSNEPQYYNLWYCACAAAESAYLELLSQGATPQEARSVLPNSTKTAIWCTYNLRELRHFLKLRTEKGAHPQMRQIAIPLLSALRKRLPAVFSDIDVDVDTISEPLLGNFAEVRIVSRDFTMLGDKEDEQR